MRISSQLLAASASTISLTHSRARGADDCGHPAARCELRGGARQPSGFNNSVRVALTFSVTPRAREALMMAGAGGAMRATGWRATAIRFQQFGEGGSYGIAR